MIFRLSLQILCDPCYCFFRIFQCPSLRSATPAAKAVIHAQLPGIIASGENNKHPGTDDNRVTPAAEAVSVLINSLFFMGISVETTRI